MRSKLYLIFLLITFFTSCRDESMEYQLINQAERLLETKPDSAYLLLDSITMADNLSNKLLARWCMLYGKAADKMHEDMPYVSQLLRARTWFEKHGNSSEQAQIGLFLGRSYVEDREYMKAMDAYMQALEVAEKAKKYDLAGHINSYMGDLYELKNLPAEALNKYNHAADYFMQAGNQRSHALALRDMARTLAYQDSCSLALEYLLKANAIVAKLDDTEAIASIENGLGNIYALLKDTVKAESYYIKSLETSSANNSPSYLALSNLYFCRDKDKAWEYLNKAKNLSTKNPYTSIAIIYQQYELEKINNNTQLALFYLEQYQNALDSIYDFYAKADILDIEKRYDHVKVLNENNKLRFNNLIGFILLIIAVVTALIVYIAYLQNNKMKNEKIYEQESKLNELSRELDKKKKELSIQGSLEDNENKLSQIKNDIFHIKNELVSLQKKKLLSSPIAKKVIKLSQNVIPGSAQSLLSYKEWNLIKNTVDETYPSFKDCLNIKEGELTLSEEQYCYLSFFELDIRAESILLNITSDSVTKRRYRIRLKLGIVGEDKSLYAYFIDKMYLFD